MEEKTASTLFEEFKDDVSSYIRDTVQLSKLEAFEKIGVGSSVIAYSLILMFFALFALATLFVTLGFYLAELLQSTWQGFGIVSAATILIVIILLFAKKSLTKFFTNRVIEFLMEDKNKNK
ncbi:MAG: phage holin family protein [Petrimonas sp.]|nr:phage holin family protein [Petrimonas sp.]